MGSKLTKISEYTVGSGGISSFDFSITSGDWDYLVLWLSLRTAVSANSSQPMIRFNDDSTNGNYVQTYFYGDGSNVGGGTDSTTGVLVRYHAGANANSNVFGNSVVYINDVSGSNHKSYHFEGVSPWTAANNVGHMAFTAGRWKSTSAITKVTISGNGNNLSQYSKATLYGLKAS